MRLDKICTYNVHQDEISKAKGVVSTLELGIIAKTVWRYHSNTHPLFFKSSSLHKAMVEAQHSQLR